MEADTAVIEYFRKTYGIWQDREQHGQPERHAARQAG
jgi:hypothetical protein